ncbi:MAG: efflux RND transporter periplasmic adaptor subunit [Verrucomicrobia bacterium]|jgi:membrane fusion protein (multidrug efflux system)|nr:efflux RND transporter periplasmic adaptor subunit [Verrucomicrobiota bacterium]
MFKKIIFVLSLFVLIGLIVGFVVTTKLAQFGSGDSSAGGPPPETVSTYVVEQQVWERGIDAVGTVEPIRGVLLENEVSGVVASINFANGEAVEAGDVLVQLDIKVERAQLRAAQADLSLAEIEFERNQRLRKNGNIPQSQLDRAIADLERAKAEVENIEAVIDRKTIRAPFDGRAGIRRINLGQFLPTGAPIVSVQAFDRVYINFNLPQSRLDKITDGLSIDVFCDGFPDETFSGEITAINPLVDPVTRSVEIQGTIENTGDLLRSGLFVRVRVRLPEDDEVLVVPSTAILYAPYGNSVYRVVDAEGDDGGKVVNQAFVRIGRRMGDLVAIESGLEAGEEIVSAGAFKLRNNAPVRINNDLAPKPEKEPTPPNS